eukprot:717689-Pelagomonas_calceolata.AAC.1
MEDLLQNLLTSQICTLILLGDMNAMLIPKTEAAVIVMRKINYIASLCQTPTSAPLTGTYPKDPGHTGQR